MIFSHFICSYAGFPVLQIACCASLQLSVQSTFFNAQYSSLSLFTYSELYRRAFLPVHCNGSHWVYGRKHGSDGEEVLKPAVTQAKVPVIVKRIHKVKKGVKARHGNVRESQVDNEVIGHSPHAPVSEDNPDHCDVPSDGHQDDEGVRYTPESHLGEERRPLMSASYTQLQKKNTIKELTNTYIFANPTLSLHRMSTASGIWTDTFVAHS